MKNTLIFCVGIVFFTMIYFGCDDAGVNENEKTYQITGTVTSWTQGIKILKAVVTDSSGANTFLADSTTIDASGNFQVNLKVPPENYPWQYNTGGATCTHNAVITPSNLKMASVTLKVYNANTQIGSISRRNFSVLPVANSYMADYVYFNSDYGINGVDTCTVPGGFIRSNINLSGSKGWNKTVLVFKKYEPPTEINTDVTNNEPNGGWWAYVPVP